MPSEYEQEMSHCLCGPSCCTDEGVAKDIDAVLSAYAKTKGLELDKVREQYTKGVTKVYETIDERFGDITVGDIVAEALRIDKSDLERAIEFIGLKDISD